MTNEKSIRSHKGEIKTLNNIIIKLGLKQTYCYDPRNFLKDSICLKLLVVF